jgi:hypothetical protein
MKPLLLRQKAKKKPTKQHYYMQKNIKETSWDDRLSHEKEEL